MRKTAFAAAVLIALGWAGLAWSDNSAQDAADYATQHGPLTCTGAGR
jgi:hypothetical protein